MLEGFEKYLDPAPRSSLSREASDPGLLRQVRDSALNGGALRSGAIRGFATDAAIAGGMAFLEAELEKRDPKVREPLTSVTWARDIPVRSGGGWVDFTSVFSVDYAVSGPNFYGLVGGQSTQIPMVQANLNKDYYKVFNWENVLKINFIDMQKLQGVGRSLDDLLDKGVKLNWNKTLDLVTYQGPFSSTTYPGLINNPNITAASVAVGALGFTAWNKKSPAEILNDVNAAMVSTWAASQYDVTGMANHILIPASQFGYICSQLVSSAGNVSILTYLLENNIGKTQGVDLKIFPSRWCAAAGAAGTDRMVCYVNDEDRVYLDVTVPIQRVMTTPNISEGGGAYLTLYAGQVGVVKFLYTQPALYQDGI